MIVKSYSEIGKKKANEDYVLYNNNSLIVCDGVGGATKGELASKESATFIADYFEKNEINKEGIQNAILATQQHLNALVSKQPELNGMATTIAASFITTSNEFYVVHMGDSRVYLVRPSTKSFWHTWDHSFVSGLVKSGEITREAARHHPMNNQITKALKGNLESKVREPDIQFINDLRKGDILFICSDGISESFSDLELLNLLSNTNNTIEETLKIIKERCIQQSYDNHSAIICLLEKKDIPDTTIIPVNWLAIESLTEQQDLDFVEPEINGAEMKYKRKKWYHFFK